jgi:hypothetical protein
MVMPYKYVKVKNQDLMVKKDVLEFIVKIVKNLFGDSILLFIFVEQNYKYINYEIQN